MREVNNSYLSDIKRIQKNHKFQYIEADGINFRYILCGEDEKMSLNDQSAEIDWKRVKHLLKLGIFAALMVFAADMILGWGNYNYDAEGLPPMFARFLLVSDGRIIASALLGLVGIPPDI